MRRRPRVARGRDAKRPGGNAARPGSFEGARLGQALQRVGLKEAGVSPALFHVLYSWTPLTS